MLNDPLANALSTIKNAERKGKGKCIIQPSSKVIGGVLNLLKDRGYVGKIITVGKDGDQEAVELEYHDDPDIDYLSISDEREADS